LEVDLLIRPADRAKGSMAASIASGAPEAEEVQPEEESAYFSELLSYSLERLSKEPELLRADQEQLRRQLQDTAVGHYRSFIDTTQCLADLKEQLQAATEHLDALGSDLPKLQGACDRFRHDAAAIATKRADNRQLYSERPLLHPG
jgi:predicted RNase H-like nuclease (RuvC/YqgF family)